MITVLRKSIRIEIEENITDARELFDRAIMGQRGTVDVGGYRFDIEFDGPPDSDEYGVWDDE